MVTQSPLVLTDKYWQYSEVQSIQVKHYHRMGKDEIRPTPGFLRDGPWIWQSALTKSHEREIRPTNLAGMVLDSGKVPV